MAFDATTYASGDLHRWISPKDYGAHGSSITSLLDKSGNSDHLNSVSGSVTVDDGFFPSGAKAIKFASGAKASHSSAVALGTSYSIYFVSQGTTASTGSYQGLIDGDIGVERRFQIRHENGGILAISFYNNNSSNYQTSASSVDELNPQIYCMIVEPGTDGLKVYEDNVEIASGDGGNSTSAQRIGVNSASNIAGGERRYGDIVIYESAHDSTTRTAIYDDLYADYIDTTQSVEPTAIASTETFGTLGVGIDQTVSPTALASTETFGTLGVGIDQTVSPTAVASAVTLGSPTVEVVSSAFDPTSGPDSANLVAWYTPSDATLSGSDVTNWGDSSANSVDLSSKTGTVQKSDSYFPTGADAIHFSDSSSLVSGSTFSSFGPSETIYFVVKMPSDPGFAIYPLIAATFANGVGHFSAAFVLDWVRYAIGLGSTIDSPNIEAQDVAVYCITGTTGTGNAYLYRNGVEIDSGTGGSNTGDNFYMCVNRQSYTTTGNSTEMYYGDIVVYNSEHSQSDRDTITDALITQYIGIPSQEVGPDAIASGASLGSPSIELSVQSAYPDSVGSSLTIGTHTVSKSYEVVSPDSVASTNSFGTVVATVGTPQVIEPDSYVNVPSVGTPEIVLDIFIYPEPITDTVFGTLELNAGAQYIYPDPIEPETAIGTVEVSGGSMSSDANESVLVVTGSAYIDISAFRLI